MLRNPDLVRMCFGTSQRGKDYLNAYRKIDAALECTVLEFLDWVFSAWPRELWRRAFSRDGQFVVMQLNLDIAGFDAWKLQTGCDRLRVRIFAKVHSGGYVRTTARKREKHSQAPGPEDLVWRLVGIVPREILSRILLGKGSFEAFERIGVEKVVWVMRPAGWIVWHLPVGGGGRR